MATDERESPSHDAVRRAALEGVIASLEAELAREEGTRARKLAAELAARRRELDAL